MSESKPPPHIPLSLIDDLLRTPRESGRSKRRLDVTRPVGRPARARDELHWGPYKVEKFPNGAAVVRPDQRVTIMEGITSERAIQVCKALNIAWTEAYQLAWADFQDLEKISKNFSKKTKKDPGNRI